MSPSILRGWLTLTCGRYLRLRYVAGEWELKSVTYVAIELGRGAGPGVRIQKLSVRISSESWSGIPHRLVHLFADQSAGLPGRFVVAPSGQFVVHLGLTREDREHS